MPQQEEQRLLRCFRSSYGSFPRTPRASLCRSQLGRAVWMPRTPWERCRVPHSTQEVGCPAAVAQLWFHIALTSTTPCAASSAQGSKPPTSCSVGRSPPCTVPTKIKSKQGPHPPCFRRDVVHSGLMLERAAAGQDLPQEPLSDNAAIPEKPSATLQTTA